MVWRMLRDLAVSTTESGLTSNRKDDTVEHARRVEKGCAGTRLVAGPFGEMFAWSVDLKGNHPFLR